MNQLHRDWLRENHTKLVNNIESIEVADILYSKDCLSQDDVERIQKAVTHKDKVKIYAPIVTSTCVLCIYIYVLFYVFKT